MHLEWKILIHFCRTRLYLSIKVTIFILFSILLSVFPVIQVFGILVLEQQKGEPKKVYPAFIKEVFKLPLLQFPKWTPPLIKIAPHCHVCGQMLHSAHHRWGGAWALHRDKMLLFSSLDAPGAPSLGCLQQEVGQAATGAATLQSRAHASLFVYHDGTWRYGELPFCRTKAPPHRSPHPFNYQYLEHSVKTHNDY